MVSFTIELIDFPAPLKRSYACRRIRGMAPWCAGGNDFTHSTQRSRLMHINLLTTEPINAHSSAHIRLSAQNAVHLLTRSGACRRTRGMAYTMVCSDDRSDDAHDCLTSLLRGSRSNTTSLLPFSVSNARASLILSVHATTYTRGENLRLSTPLRSRNISVVWPPTACMSARIDPRTRTH